MATLRTYIKELLNRRKLRKQGKVGKGKKDLSKKLAEQFNILEEKIGYTFSDKTLLKLALTHPSSLTEAHSRILSNQRLEFLGDSVLQTIISDFVYKHFDDKPEGDLTRARIALTRGSFLSNLAQNLSIPQNLILPKKLSYLREVCSAKEDALESLIGAIYLDSDFEKVKSVVLCWYEMASLNMEEMVGTQNPKGQLQELAAKLGKSVEYKLSSQFGPDHDKKFEMEVLIDGQVMGKAVASSKKEAQTQAAAKALQKLSL